MDEQRQLSEVELRFNDELDLLKQALNEADELYDEIKLHYDAIKNSTGRGTLSFVQNQTSSLVSLKTMKLQIIKEQIGIKKNIMDIEIKKKNSEGEEGADNKVVAMVLQELNKKDSTDNKLNQVVNEIDTDNVESFEDELERRLQELESEGALVFSESEKNAKEERNGANKLDVDALIKSVMNDELSDDEEEEVIEYEMEEEEIYTEDDEEHTNYVTIVVAVNPSNKEDWCFVAIDEEDNIVEDYELPDPYEFLMRFTKNEDKVVAIDQFDKMYRVIVK